MTIEHATIRVVPKPWGRTDLRPWSDAGQDGQIIGELWFGRPGANTPETSLLLKLLFTSEPLSIQVHPDDTFARSLGLPRGKSEAWYVLSAAPDAKVALGLSGPSSPGALRHAIEDRSIETRVQWRAVRLHETISVPAGTIHALGAGLVVAEIQQRSDTTFRLFDFGRNRDLQIDQAVAVANLQPAKATPAELRLTEARVLLLASPAFVLERVELPPDSRWEIDASVETWLLVIEGSVGLAGRRVALGESVFLENAVARAEAGPRGCVALLAYVAAQPSDTLLTVITASPATAAALTSDVAPNPLPSNKASA